MRGEQLARQWRILRHLEASTRGLTVAELAELEGISPRSAYRDIEALLDAGFPLKSKRDTRTNRWAFMDTYRFRVPQPFTLTELLALHLYGDLIRVFEGTSVYEALESLFKKIRATLPPKTLSYLERVQNTFAVGFKSYHSYGRLREILNRVNQAVIEGRRIEVAYRSLRSESETLRKLDPYKIWFLDGTMYLIGFCHLRKEVRIFVVDRIRMLHVTGESFEVPDDFDLQAFMAHSFKVRQDELRTVKVRISAAWARWAGEKIWHESQKGRLLPDGRLELTFQVAGLDEIKMWVLSLGSQVEVLEPQDLTDLLVRDIEALRSMYQEKDKEKTRSSG